MSKADNTEKIDPLSHWGILQQLVGDHVRVSLIRTSGPEISISGTLIQAAPTKFGIDFWEDGELVSISNSATIEFDIEDVVVISFSYCSPEIELNSPDNEPLTGGGA